MKNKKINIYINGVYICSTTQARTCKEEKEKILKHNAIIYQSINGIVTRQLAPGDTLAVTYSK